MLDSKSILCKLSGRGPCIIAPSHNERVGTGMDALAGDVELEVA